MNNYFIYIIRCSNNSLYTGITTDIERRMKEHKNKTKSGAKYTHSHSFLKLEIYFQTSSRSLASKLEYAIKRLNKYEKEQIIKTKSLKILEDKINIEEYQYI